MIEWPGLPAVGIIGASYARAAAPEGSPFNGAMVPMLDLDKALSIVQNYHFFAVETTANGGNTAFDGLPGPGSRGYKSQFEALINRTTWPFSGKNYLKILIIDGTNSCLHNQGTFTGNPCTHEEMQAVVEEIEYIAILAHSMGIHVIITGLMNYADLIPDLIKDVYFLDWFIDQESFEYLSNLIATSAANLPALYYPVWQEVGIKTFDGVHPFPESMLKVARNLLAFILRNKLI